VFPASVTQKLADGVQGTPFRAKQNWQITGHYFFADFSTTWL